MIRKIKFLISTFLFAVFAACAHSPNKAERLESLTQFTDQYANTLERYRRGKAKSSEVIAHLQNMVFTAPNNELRALISMDICKISFSEGFVRTLGQNDCQARFYDYFVHGYRAPEQSCGKPSDLLMAYFIGVREPEASQERVILKDLAVQSVQCMPPLPAINIGKARYTLLLRILQAQTGKQAGVSLPDDIARRSEAWLAEVRE